MSRRNQPMPHHGSPHELRLLEIVNELVGDDSQKQAYLAFAHELMMSRRRDSMALVIPRERSDSRNPAARQTGRDLSIGVGVTKGRDPSQRTKRIVAKWFGRGLHGNLLWLIGEAVPQGRMP